MDLMSIYDRLPVFLQNTACSLEGIKVRHNKYGRRQKRELERFMERNTWSYEQKCTYRDQQLQKMVEHCYFHVPYYRRLFSERGIDYKSIKSLSDLAVLPILTKQIVKDNFKDLLADNVKKSELMPMRTSGTTGSGFQFYYTKHAYAAQWADKERHDYNLGLVGKYWAAYFGGRSIVPKEKNNPPFYRINYAMREILFSAFHLSPSNFPNYIEGLEKKKMKMWHGYTSSFYSLARYMNDNNIRLSYVPDVILLSSENTTEEQLDTMERAFGVRPLQGYSLTEQVATFRQFPDQRMMIMEDLSAVELLPTGDDGVYRVVGSTLTNYGMPFLRYDTKDLVNYRETKDGREILSIDGREEDCIKLRDGGVIRRLGYIFKSQKNIAESQIVQKSLDVVEFHIVKGKDYSKQDESKLCQDIEAYLGGRISFQMKYVDTIPKTKNGKMKFIVSEL